MECKKKLQNKNRGLDRHGGGCLFNILILIMVICNKIIIIINKKLLSNILVLFYNNYNDIPVVCRGTNFFFWGTLADNKNLTWQIAYSK